MSFSNWKAAEKLMERAGEFDEILSDQIDAEERLYATIYREQANVNRLDLDTVLPMIILNWRKGDHSALFQPFEGSWTIEDLRCLAQDIEENSSEFIRHISDDSIQYSAIKVIESTPKIHKANVGVFGVNTCGLQAPRDETFFPALDEIRHMILREGLEDKDIFMKDFLIFPIVCGDLSACFVIVNPSALLQDTVRFREDRGKCSLIEIRTGINSGEFKVAKDYIAHILDRYRSAHFRGEFREVEQLQAGVSRVPYDEYKQIEVPLIGAKQGPFQVLWILREILKNSQNIQAYFDGPAEQMGQDLREVKLGVKKIRMHILREISFDVRDNATDIQKYIFEKRISELHRQERERKRLHEERGEMFTAYPPVARLA